MKFLSFDSAKSNNLLSTYGTLANLKDKLTPDSAFNTFIDNTKQTVNDKLNVIADYFSQARNGVDSFFSVICDNIDTMTNLDTAVLHVECLDYDNLDYCLENGIAVEITEEQYERITNGLINIDGSLSGDGYNLALPYYDDRTLFFHFDGSTNTGTSQSTLSVTGACLSYESQYRFPVTQAITIDNVTKYYVYKYIPEVYDIENIGVQAAMDVYSFGLLAKLVGDSTVILDIFEKTTSEIANFGDLQVDQLKDYILSKVDHLSDACADTLNEISYQYTRFGVAGVIQYIKRLFDVVKSADVDSGDRLVFTDNEGLKTKSAWGMIFSGVISTITQVAAFAVSVIHPVISIATSLLGTLVSNVVKAVDLKIANVTLAVLNPSCDQHWYPMGLGQITIPKSSNLINSEFLTAIENNGCIKIIGPGFECLVSQTEDDIGLEVHLTPWVKKTDALMSLINTNNWITKASGSTGDIHFNVPNNGKGTWDSILAAYNSDFGDLEYTHTSVALDEELRDRYKNALLYFNVCLLMSILRWGYGTLTFAYDTSDSIEQSMWIFLNDILIEGEYRPGHRFTWSEITGKTYDAACYMWLDLTGITLSTWSTVITGHVLGFPELFILTLPYCLMFLLTGVGKADMSSTCIPVTKLGAIYVNIPEYSREQFIAALIFTGVLIAATTALGVTIGIKAKKKMDSLAAKRQQAIESAWNAYTDKDTGGTTEQYQAYRAAVKKNNFISRLTGGTIYSKSNYWDTSSSDNGIKDATLLDRIVGVLHIDRDPSSPSSIQLDSANDEPNLLKLSKSIKQIDDDLGDQYTALVSKVNTINNNIDTLLLNLTAVRDLIKRV